MTPSLTEDFGTLSAAMSAARLKHSARPRRTMERHRQRRRLWRLPMLPPLPLLLLLLPTAQALPMEAVPAPAQRQLKGVPMNGHCAVVSHHDSWEDDATGMVCCALPKSPELPGHRAAQPHTDRHLRSRCGRIGSRRRRGLCLASSSGTLSRSMSRYTRTRFTPPICSRTR